MGRQKQAQFSRVFVLVTGCAWLLVLLGAGMADAQLTVETGRGPESVRPRRQRVADLVLIPGGTVQIGDDAGPSDERPAFRYTSRDFLMDRTPVTVAQFAAFVHDTGYKTDAERYGSAGVLDEKQGGWVSVDGADWQHPLGPGRSRASADHPVTQVSWFDAAEFCRAYGLRLPTELEWERAARMGQTPDGHVFQIGDPIELSGRYRLNAWEGEPGADGYPGTSPVGAFGVAPSGLTDMAGNVWEWTDSWYVRYGSSSRSAADEERVARGGSFLCSPSFCEGYRASARNHTTPDTSLENIGFRCVGDVGQVTGLAGHVTGAAGTRAHAMDPPKPNVIVILADDLGYGDTGVYGSSVIKTPNIDALAASGIRFTAGYVTNPVCAPSRAALMTGRYQQRFGYEFNPTGRDKSGGVSLHEVMLAQIMKSAGYATGMIGKWHLGQPAGYYPSDRGFDYFFGMAGGGSDYILDPAPGDEFIGPQGRDIKIPEAGLSALPEAHTLKAVLERIREKNPISRNHEVVRVDDYLTDAFTHEAVDFIDQHRDKPFFLYLAQHVPHAPLQAPKKYIERYANVADAGKRVYAAMVSALDDSVGAIIAKLREDGLYQNTFVVFLSDNGCPGYVRGACSNAPLSGFKRWQLEGGIRIPYIVSWPGHLPAGRVDARQVSSLDIVPTAAKLAHARLPTDRSYDGVDLLPYLMGVDGAVPNPRLYWRNGPNFAMRDDNWKLWIADRAPRDAQSQPGRGGRAKVVPTVGPEGQHVMLFDLDQDISEKRNLAGVHPAEVTRLKGEIDHWNEALVDPMWPTSKHSNVDYDGETLELFY